MKTLYSHEQLQTRMAELGQKISEDYKGETVLLVGVLKGCTIFMAHLMMHLKGNFEMDFMTLSSYKHGSESGELKIIQDLDTVVKDRHVLIVEDIIDTGKTLAFVQPYLKDRKAKSVETVTLIDKPTRREKRHVLDAAKYVGFEYDQSPFVVGFGFDFREHYRNLPHVYMMDEEDKDRINDLLD